METTNWFNTGSLIEILTKEGRIFQQAIKEGKDPKQAVVNHIVPENKPELMMINLRKCLGGIGDDEAAMLISDWAKAEKIAFAHR